MYNRAITIQGTAMYDTPIAVANKYGMGGGFVAYAYGWLADSTNAVFIGVIATIVGLVVSVVGTYFKHKRESRAATLNEELARNEEARRKEIHEATLRTMQVKTGV